MNKVMTRRNMMLSAAVMAAPTVARGADPVFRLRCSLDTPPAHARNKSMRDYFNRIEAGSQGRIKPELFESGQLFPDLDIAKALIQNQADCIRSASAIMLIVAVAVARVTSCSSKRSPSASLQPACSMRGSCWRASGWRN